MEDDSRELMVDGPRWLARTLVVVLFGVPGLLLAIFVLAGRTSNAPLGLAFSILMVLVAGGLYVLFGARYESPGRERRRILAGIVGVAALSGLLIAVVVAKLAGALA